MEKSDFEKDREFDERLEHVRAALEEITTIIVSRDDDLEVARATVAWLSDPFGLAEFGDSLGLLYFMRMMHHHLGDVLNMLSEKPEDRPAYVRSMASKAELYRMYRWFIEQHFPNSLDMDIDTGLAAEAVFIAEHDKFLKETS